MCLIIDVNIAPQIFPEVKLPDFKPIYDAISKKRARLVYGGQLTKEYEKLHIFWEYLDELDRAGKTRQVPDEEVDSKTQELNTAGRCMSNDAHIIALALIGKVRLLCSSDEDLEKDFTNRELLNPRGKVFKYKRHSKLIWEHCKGVSGG
ncbi:MAG: PIN domain-containing protein [Deltaproteobacteria bacterium]|nr:PIN domain-containing protein [Deltaproteobacteria bacterium]